MKYSGNSPRTRATYCFRIVLLLSWCMNASAASRVFAINIKPLVRRSRRLQASFSQRFPWVKMGEWERKGGGTYAWD
jgi:hypothetical protein